MRRRTPKRAAAVARYARLRAAGVPALVTSDAAWHLSGGIIGTPGGDGPADVPLARIAARVPDCEHFLDDYREATS